jgi:hypothetical protein
MADSKVVPDASFHEDMSHHEHYEKVPRGVDSRNLDEDEEFTLEEQRRIIHKVDRRLVIATGALYATSYIDRGNLGFASIAGMTEELELSVGYRYVSHGMLKI